MACYNISISKISNSSVAQLVEQMTVNHRVAGSSPARGANNINNYIRRKVWKQQYSVPQNVHGAIK